MKPTGIIFHIMWALSGQWTHCQPRQVAECDKWNTEKYVHTDIVGENMLKKC